MSVFFLLFLLLLSRLNQHVKVSIAQVKIAMLLLSTANAADTIIANM